MDTLDSRCLSVSVCVLETNPLAAEHLQRILSKERMFAIRTLKSVASATQFLTQPEKSVFVISQAGIPASLPILLEEMERLFPGAGQVFVGELEFWKELQQLATRDRIGFVHYASVLKKLVPTIRRIANRLPAGNPWASRVDLQSNQPERTEVWQKMTKREAEILQLVQYRLSNKEIAHILNVAEVTVKFHVSNILAKANVDSRRGLLALVDQGPAA
jgi:DNA-binding NarL/FixJ family response regulator